MKIKAIVPYFGGKRKLAPDIVKQLGEHVQYFEPFCGSMAVLFAKGRSRNETVNDLHGDLINLARVLQHPTAAPDLYHRLQSVIFHEGLLGDAADRLDDESSLSLIVAHKEAAHQQSIERAYWYFLASWMMRNGVAGTMRLEYQLAVRWTKNGGSPTTRWRSAIDSIPHWHERLLNVVILRRDAFEICDRFEDCKETAIYIDPPYLDTSRSGFGDHGNGPKYKHEFSHNDPMFGDDHARLRDILAAYKKARVVVSYYDHPRIRELYRGWTFIDKMRAKNISAQNGPDADRSKAPELLIVNGREF